MTSMLEPILGQLDRRVIILFIAIMAVGIILALIKKVFKIVFVLGAFVAIALLIMPMAEDFQERYQFSLANGELSITVDGEEYTIDRLECKEITVTNLGLDGGYSLSANLGDEVLNIKIPVFMVSSIEGFADRYDIPIKINT